MLDDFDDLLKAPVKKKVREIALTPLGTLLSEPDEAFDWLLDNILISGGLALLTGRPKSGKSHFARQLAIAVSRGEKFLGRKTQAGPVVLLAMEEKRSELKRHFIKMNAAGTEPIHVHSGSLEQNSTELLGSVAETLKPVLIIVDPLFRLIRATDVSDYAQMTNSLEPLLVLARQSGACILCVHHATKTGKDDERSILGSTAVFGIVDTAILLNRTKDISTVQTRQRYGADLEETVLCYHKDSRTFSPGELRTEVDTKKAMALICEILLDADSALTEPEISKQISGSTAAKRSAIRALVTLGKLIRSGAGTKGDPYFYRLQSPSF